jgi:hypothetical protein
VCSTGYDYEFVLAISLSIYFLYGGLYKGLCSFFFKEGILDGGGNM